MTISKRVILAAFIAAISLALGAAAPSAALAAGSTRIVDDDYPSASACQGAGYFTIQDAVATILPGQSGTVTVCAGTYNETPSFSNLGKVKLIGKPGAIISAPGATSLILAQNTKLLTVQGFIVDGAGLDVTSGMIEIHDSSAVISKNVFQNSPNGSGVSDLITGGVHSLKVTGNQFTGVGFTIYAASTGGVLSAKVSNNTITGTYSGMIIAALPGGSAKASVTGNYVQGPTGGVAGISGIEVGRVNRLKVSRNTIQGFNVGISVTDSSRITVSRNRVRSNTRGITIHANLTSASSNRVQGNIVEAGANAFLGIYISADAGMTADFNQIKGNTITNPGGLFTGTAGISLGNYGGSMNKTALKGNRLINILYLYVPGGDTNTVISGNKCMPAAPCIP